MLNLIFYTPISILHLTKSKTYYMLFIISLVMSSENIYKMNNLYRIIKVKNHKQSHYGSFKDYDDAEFIRDLLVKYDWNVELISKLSPYFRFKDMWIILHVINGKLYIMDKFKTKNEAQNKYMSSLKHFMRNPHNSEFF